MDINSLSSDPLSLITRHLSAYDICCLWLCGDRKLNDKLANGGVVYFDLHYRYATNLKWPKIVRRFRGLLEFDIEISVGHIFLLAVNLHDLPSTLSKLHLSIPNSLYFLLEKPTATQAFDTPHFHTMIDLANMFPTLTTLQIEAYGVSGFPRFFPKVDLFSRLPHKLQVLMIDFRVENDALTFMASQFYFLPPSIESLCIPLDYKTTIPKHWNFEWQPTTEEILGDLEIARKYQNQIWTRFVQDSPFPAHLRSLVFCLSGRDYEDHKYHPPFAHRSHYETPANLSTESTPGSAELFFYFNTDIFDLYSLLPSSIDQLDLSSWEYSTFKKAFYFDNLPKSLRTFNAWATHTSLDFSVFPPNLTSICLSLRRFGPASQELLKSIPRTVTDLDLYGVLTEYWTNQEKIDIWKYLPAGIERTSHYFSKLVFVENISFIPKTLNFISLSEDFSPADIASLPSDTRLTEICLATYSDAMIDALPRKLTKLEIQNSQHAVAGKCSYPPGLKHLYLRNISLSGAEFFNSLPKYLTRITLDVIFYAGWLHLLPLGVKQFSAQEIVPYKSSRLDNNRITKEFELEQQQELEANVEWMTLPHTVTSLRFSLSFSEFDFSTDLSTMTPQDPVLPWYFELIRRLPPKLKSLTTGDGALCNTVIHVQRHSANFNKMMFSLLPTGLKDYTGEAHGMRDSYFAWLPSKLSDIHLFGQDSQLTPELFAYLPSSTVSIHLPMPVRRQVELVNVVPSKYPPNLYRVEFMLDKGRDDFKTVPKWLKILKDLPRTYEDIEDLDGYVNEIIQLKASQLELKPYHLERYGDLWKNYAKSKNATSRQEGT